VATTLVAKAKERLQQEEQLGVQEEAARRRSAIRLRLLCAYAERAPIIHDEYTTEMFHADLRAVTAPCLSPEQAEEAAVSLQETIEKIDARVRTRWEYGQRFDVIGEFYTPDLFQSDLLQLMGDGRPLHEVQQAGLQLQVKIRHLSTELAPIQHVKRDRRKAQRRHRNTVRETDDTKDQTPHNSLED